MHANEINRCCQLRACHCSGVAARSPRTVCMDDTIGNVMHSIREYTKHSCYEMQYAWQRHTHTHIHHHVQRSRTTFIHTCVMNTRVDFCAEFRNIQIIMRCGRFSMSIQKAFISIKWTFSIEISIFISFASNTGFQCLLLRSAPLIHWNM